MGHYPPLAPGSRSSLALPDARLPSGSAASASQYDHLSLVFESRQPLSSAPFFECARDAFG